MKRFGSQSEEDQNLSRSYEEGSSSSSGQYLAPGFLQDTDSGECGGKDGGFESDNANGKAIEMAERAKSSSSS